MWKGADERAAERGNRGEEGNSKSVRSSSSVQSNERTKRTTQFYFEKRQITGVYAMINTIYWHNNLSFKITHMYTMFDHMYTFLLNLLFITDIYIFLKNFEFLVMIYDDF